MKAQYLHRTHWTLKQRHALDAFAHSLPVTRVTAHALAKAVDIETCLDVVKQGAVVELHNIPLTVVLRDNEGNCIAVDIEGKPYIAAYWYNNPNDNHATLNARRYLPPRNPIKWLRRQGYTVHI